MTDREYHARWRLLLDAMAAALSEAHVTAFTEGWLHPVRQRLVDVAGWLLTNYWNDEAGMWRCPCSRKMARCVMESLARESDHAA